MPTCQPTRWLLAWKCLIGVVAMRCLQCDLENREGRKFCAKCGAALGWACPDCGFANSPGESFCGGCGRSAVPTDRAADIPAPAAAGAESAGERRQVAVLFADLCGFTALSTRLDAEDLRRLVEGFHTGTNAIITQYGGAVDKHIGNVVMALFGSSIAHGDE